MCNIYIYIVLSLFHCHLRILFLCEHCGFISFFFFSYLSLVFIENILHLDWALFVVFFFFAIHHPTPWKYIFAFLGLLHKIDENPTRATNSLDETHETALSPVLNSPEPFPCSTKCENTICKKPKFMASSPGFLLKTIQMGLP